MLSIDNLNENDLEKLIAEYLKDDSESQASKFIPNKVKKNKNIQKEKEEENSPLSSHRRKNGDQTDLVTKNDLLEGKSQQTCSASQFKVEPNVIIDSKASIQKGARLINMEFISKETAQQGLNKLQESCMKQCCESESCDSALLSMRIGVEGYRCYLFECNQNCLYVRHGDYIVLRMKSPEQLDHNKEANVITTGHKDSNEINNAGDEKLLENVNPNDKIYFQNKENANTSTGDIIVAIFLLVIGISLVLALFTYLIMSTKYVSKRITWLRKLNMKHKNVDVDPTLEADYLINGMYL